MDRVYDSILVTGGAGYCGSRLVPQLLNEGYKVVVYDIMYFGSDQLPTSHPGLTVIEGDIRDVGYLSKYLENIDVVLSLACISNDASFELDEELSTSINLDAFEPMVLAAKEQGIQRFIHASSSSVYGISDEPEVTEDHPLVPLTLYNKYKGLTEPLLFKHTNDSFTGVVFRPATVCGYSPRLRLDLSVNILTNHAITNQNIRVFGGSQLRPNLHIQDYCDLCSTLISAPKDKIANQVFNYGFENMSIMNLAEIVKAVVEKEYPGIGEVSISVESSDDVRSYHINSEKIKRILGLRPRYTIENAVLELCDAFRQQKIKNSMEDDKFFNVRKLKNMKAV